MPRKLAEFESQLAKMATKVTDELQRVYCDIFYFISLKFWYFLQWRCDMIPIPFRRAARRAAEVLLNFLILLSVEAKSVRFRRQLIRRISSRTKSLESKKGHQPFRMIILVWTWSTLWPCHLQKVRWCLLLPGCLACWHPLQPLQTGDYWYFSRRTISKQSSLGITPIGIS